MTRLGRLATASSAVLAALVAAPPPARAQAPETVAPTKFDPAMCEPARTTPDPPPPGAGSDVPAVSPRWDDFELEGTFVDPRQTVHDLLAPTMRRNNTLSDTTRAEIGKSARAFGYHVVGLRTRETPTGTRAVIHLAPMPMVKRLKVVVKQSWFAQLLDDEIRRRMSVRVGAYLPWNPTERACKLYEEAANIEKFLRDEGHFEARAVIEQRSSGVGLTLDVNVVLGPAYTVDADRIQIADAASLAVDADDIRAQFRHRGTCLVGPYICLGKPRFSRTQHQTDLQAVVDLFHARGYPAVRVRSNYDPAISVDRRTKQVRFGLTIDQRRRLDVQFEGYSPGGVALEALKKQLTFDQASSTDDVEAAESAKALAAYLQSRGYFDARVTWNRERFSVFDRLTYRIELGGSRVVRSVGFTGNRAVSADELADVVGTKPERLSTSLFGANTAATYALLESDRDRIVDLYRRKGYRDARVRVAAATDPNALDSAALTAGFLSANRGGGSIHVRFAIDEGQPTLLAQIRVEVDGKSDAITTPEQRELCRLVLADIAELHGYPGFATPIGPDRCVAAAASLPFRENDVIQTRDALRERLYSHGRLRASVEYEQVALGPRTVAAQYRLSNVQELKVGKVVIRGNFRTRDWIIRDELRLKEGAALTNDLLADGARRLRNTALFDAVNIKMPDLDQTSGGAVNAVVEVTERYGRGQVDLELGYSSFNGTFVKVLPSFRNLFGLGISLDLTGTVGFDLNKAIDRDLELRQLAAEATLRFPQWLLGPLGFQAELTAFERRQDTPRFGPLRTTGATAAFSRTWERQRTATHSARAITTGFHYDFRSRERNLDALRPIGSDDDESQVPITTRTGSVGLTFEWEQRTDRRGALSLVPEGGFRFDGQVSFASEYLLGQDTFLKVSAAGSKYWSLGTNLVLRADLRFDQGFPLGGDALLPEVERFFAGGDATVRGYEDERLATEIIRVGVPPLSGVDQIRILPAGGNIRVLSSLDLQLRIYKVLATALFVDAGMIANQWAAVTLDDVRPSAGIALVRVVTPAGVLAFERAVPLRPQLGDDPRGRWHFSFAARAQF